MPCVQSPLWQSVLSRQRLEAGHVMPQLPPHGLLMSLGVQHLFLRHVKVSQSSLVVQPCASLHRFEQFPLQRGPQQRLPEHAPL